MSKVPLVLRELHRSETSLARALLATADRHRAEHEVFHVARDIAGWSRDHVRQLAEAGRHHGLHLAPEPRTAPLPPVEALSRRLSTALGRRPEPGLLLLADLRRLHLKAAGLSVDWELLAQVAQGTKQRPLLELAQRCHPETLRQLRWANAQIKSHAPQVLAS